MALVTCRECQRQVSDQATACPSCGAPVRPASPPVIHATIVAPAPAPKKKTSGCLAGCMSLLAVIFVMNLIRDCGGEGEMTRPAGTTRVPVATLHPQPPTATPTDKELAAANKAAAVEATRIAVDNQKGRELLAQFIEKGLLNQMIDAHVSAIGTQKKKLKIQWILMTRPWAIREMDDQEFVGSMLAAGFKEVTFTNGSQSWSWEIGKGK